MLCIKYSFLQIILHKFRKLLLKLKYETNIFDQNSIPKTYNKRKKNDVHFFTIKEKKR